MTQSKASLMIVLALFVSMFATFFAFSPAWGQEVTATITGSVTDPSGAPVVGASVLARDVERGTTLPNSYQRRRRLQSAALAGRQL